MKRLLISCCLVFLVSVRVTAQSTSTSGAANNSKPSANWATPNEIRAVSHAINFAEMPMAFSKIRTDVLGDLRLQPLCGAGGANGWSYYCAITDISDDKPYYGVVFKYKESGGCKEEGANFGDTEISAIQLYYSDEHGMEFYAQEDAAAKQVNDDIKKHLKQLNKTPWQAGVDMARGRVDSAQLEYITKHSPDKGGLVMKKHPIPFIDAQVDSIIYPPEAKVPEPKKVAEAEVIYPLKLRRSATSGKVVLCVKINETGCPIRIAVRESTNEVLDRYAIAHALQTTWETDPKNDGLQTAWFESEVEFDVIR